MQNSLISGTRNLYNTRLRVFKIENMAMNDTSLILIILKRDGVQLVKVSKFAELGFRGCALHLLKSQLGVSG